jgi:hypothetical protein
VGGTPSAFINGLFQALFDRAPDAGSVAYFTTALQGGFSRTTLTRLLLGTAEGHATTIARLFQDEFAWTAALDNLKNNTAVVYWAGYLGTD